MQRIDRISSIAALVAAIGWPASAVAQDLRELEREHAARQPESVVEQSATLGHFTSKPIVELSKHDAVLLGGSLRSCPQPGSI